MERPESLVAIGANGDSTEAVSSHPSPSPEAVEKNAAKSFPEAAAAAAAAALQDFPAVRRSPRIAMEVELASRQQKKDEQRRKALEVATGNDSVHRSRLVTPAKGQASDPPLSLSNGTTSPSPLFPQFSAMPLTPDPGINEMYEDTPQGVQESPFGDYLERRYKEIFKQEASGSSQLLPTLRDLADAVTTTSSRSCLPSNSRHDVALRLMEGSTIKQEQANADAYAPIDLARTNSNEIYQSLIDMEPSFKKPESIYSRTAPLSEEVIRKSPDPVSATKEISMAIDDSTKEDPCMLLPMLELFESGEITLPSGSTNACDLAPTLSLQPQTSIDHFRLFHEEVSWIDHIMNIESFSGLRQCHDDKELWNVMDVLHDHSDVAIVPKDTCQTAVKATKAMFDGPIKPQALLFNNPAIHEVPSQAHPPHATLELEDFANNSQSSMECHASPYTRIHDIVAANAKQIQKTKRLIKVKKRRVPKKPTTKKPKQPNARTGKQKEEKVQSLISDKMPSVVKEKELPRADALPLLAVCTGEPLFKLKDVAKTDLMDQEPNNDVENARGSIVKTEVLDRNDKIWFDNLKSLKAFHLHFGHINVPLHNPLYRKLFNWLKRQVRHPQNGCCARHCHSDPHHLLLLLYRLPPCSAHVCPPFCQGRSKGIHESRSLVASTIDGFCL